jgi:putative transcriptional regulator
MLIYACAFVFPSFDKWSVIMVVSYNGLWKLLIDKNMKKMDLVQKVGISTSTLAKMGKGEPVSLEVLGKICDKLDCDFGDIINFTRS